MEAGILLGLVLVEDVELFAQLSNRVVVLLPEVGHGLFVLNVGLFQVTSKFGQLIFTSLVELNLGGSGTARLLESFAQLFDFTRQVGTLLLGLGAGLAFSLQLLFELFDARLEHNFIRITIEMRYKLIGQQRTSSGEIS